MATSKSSNRGSSNPSLRVSTRGSSNPYLKSPGADDLSPANQIARDIIAERRDLLPSVERIMNAGLDEDATVGALSLFRASLGTTGDANRDPRVAIAASSTSPGDAALDEW
jgi:hypothetical protein